MAATLTSTQRDAQVAAALNFADRLDDHRQIGGFVQYAKCVVTTTADNDAADEIDLVELPLGAVVLPELSFIIVTDDMSSGAVTIDIGDSDTVDRYCDGANCAAVGTVQFLAPAIPDALLTEHRVTADTRLIKATMATMAATIEAGQFVVILAYKCL